MYKYKIRFLTIVMAFAMFLSIPSFASSSVLPRASEQLTSYSMNAKPTGRGRIAISFSVDGTGKMTHIGAKRISVYQEIGNTWAFVNSLNQDDEGMSTYNSYYYGNTVYYNGVSGDRYRIEVTVFAENAAGSDSRTQIFYVTA